MPRYDLGSLESFPDNTPVKRSTACRDLVAVRRGREVFLLDHACQHAGAPLSEGMMDGDCIICPWHRALIRITDGALEEPPGCRDHKRYPATIEDGHVFADIEPQEPSYRPVSFCSGKRQEGHPESIAILGAGAAGMTAAQTLAREGFDGRLTIISDEADVTFDRTRLSKAVVRDPEETYLSALQDLRGPGLQFRRAKVKAVDKEARTLHFEEGDSLQAEKLIVASGGKPRRLHVEGADLPGVLTLRTPGDAERLSTLTDEARCALIIGAGLIGMEVAAVLRSADIDVTLLDRAELPQKDIFGERIARRMLDEQRRAGVQFVPNAEVARFIGRDTVEGVELIDGRRFACDVVLVAIGIDPSTDILDTVPDGHHGGFRVGEDLQLKGCEGIFAAGDVSAVPTAFGVIRTEHWRWAQQLGRRAALSAIGQTDHRPIVPYFWTKQQASAPYHYVGHADEPDHIRFDGEVEEGNFIAYFMNADQCTAICSYGRSDETSMMERRMANAGPLLINALTHHG